MKWFQLKCLKCGGTWVKIFVESRVDFSRKSGTSLDLTMICLKCGTTETT